MDSEKVLLFNAIVYTVTLLFYAKKYRFSVGVCIWSLYTLSAWSSYFFVQQPYYQVSTHYSVQTIVPCIYLYCVFIIAMQPLFKLKSIPVIKFTNPQLVKILMIASICIQVVFILVDLPTVVSVLSSGTGMLSALRDTVYDDGLSAVTRIGLLNKLHLLYSGFRILATGFSVILLYYTKRDYQLVKLFFAVTLLNNIRMIIVMVSRGELVFVMLLYMLIFYLVRDKLSKVAKKRILLYGIPIVLLGIGFLLAISISRFGDRMEYFLFKYLGESMNNFNGILFYNAKGTTNGRVYFSIIYSMLGAEKIVTTYQKWELINSVIGIPANIFYTWVGGLIIEFGKIVPIVTSFVFNRMLNKIVKLKMYFPGDIILVVFFINFFLRGIFIFPTQNYEGMFMILYTFLLCLIFRIRKKDGKWVITFPKMKLR